MKVLLANCGVVDPESIEDYEKKGGYSALKKCLGLSPEDVIGEIEKSGLCGRGGAAFPTGMKWKFTRSAVGEKFIVCNADEGEPGTFKDRKLLEEDPHKVLEGLIIGGYAIGAKKGYIFIRGEYTLSIFRMKRAMEQAKDRGFLGEKILNTDFSFFAEVKVGAGAYICGEETALFSAIQGERGEPRLKPPFPPTSGLFYQPTAINNVETLANVPIIIERGAEWHSELGTENTKGVKIFCLSCDVKRPGLYEAEFGVTLRELIFDYAGGIVNDKPLKAILCGGASSGFLTEEHLDIPLDYKSLFPYGSSLGSGAIMVFAEGVNIVEIVRKNAEFFVHESCGVCVPCRIGGSQIYKILTEFVLKKAKREDVDLLLDLANTVKALSRCGLGQASPNPVITSINLFREDYLSLVE